MTVPLRQLREEQYRTVSSGSARQRSENTVRVKDNVTSMSGYRFPQAESPSVSPRKPLRNSSRNAPQAATYQHKRIAGESISTSHNELSRFGERPLLKRSASYEDACRNLLKVSPATSLMELTQQPCEQTFQTIHIEARNSPTPSEMARPPLYSRMWSVVTDFFSAICICLQVNRDCLFCLGFFVAFVVSASFLTAFFYRTLSTGSETMEYREVVPAGPDNIKTRDKVYYL